MIKDVKYWKRWEDKYQRQSVTDYQENIRIFEEMLELARNLKVFPTKDPLEGIEVDIKIAKIINSL